MKFYVQADLVLIPNISELIYCSFFFKKTWKYVEKLKTKQSDNFPQSWIYDAIFSYTITQQNKLKLLPDVQPTMAELPSVNQTLNNEGREKVSAHLVVVFTRQ